MITVVLVDDQELVRTGLRALLEADGQLRVVGEADDGEAAVKLVRQHRPEVVLMDLRMPGTDGLTATRRLRADPALERTRIVVLTTFDDEADIVEAVRSGAAGYLLKDTAGSDLRAAVHTVAAGGNLLSPTIARQMMEHLARLPAPPMADPRLARLADRELEVLARLSHGESNSEIGRALHLSPATVRTYVSRILTKLDARDRTELALMAQRSGLTAD